MAAVKSKRQPISALSEEESSTPEEVEPEGKSTQTMLAGAMASGPSSRQSLDSLPLELQLLIFDHVLEDTAPRMFEVQVSEDDPEPARSEALHVVPARALRPPPILHAIPQARRHLLPQYLASFKAGRGESDPRGQQHRDDRGWLIHPLIDSLLISGAALRVFRDGGFSIAGITNVVLRPAWGTFLYYSYCAERLLHGFPDLQAVTLCSVLPKVLLEEGIMAWRGVPTYAFDCGPHREHEMFALALDQQGREMHRARPIQLDWLFVMKLDADGENVYDHKGFQPITAEDDIAFLD